MCSCVRVCVCVRACVRVPACLRARMCVRERVRARACVRAYVCVVRESDRPGQKDAKGGGGVGVGGAMSKVRRTQCCGMLEN